MAMSGIKREYKSTSNTSTRGYFGFRKPTGITIHHWGNDGQKHDNVVRWLQGKNGGTSNTGSSAHLVVSGGRITQLASYDVATWHAGNRKGNGMTIGIECRPEMSAADWEALVTACVEIEKKYGSMRYYRHKDWKATACPGRYSNQIGKLVNDVNARLAGQKTPVKPRKTKPATAQKKANKSKSIAQMADEVIAGKHGNGHTARQRSLGVNNATYKKVRAEVNRRAGVRTPKPSSKTVSQMATEVLAGKHGNGHARRQASLGVDNATYAKVRAEVNRRL